jgi:hypothetical protein
LAIHLTEGISYEDDRNRYLILDERLNKDTVYLEKFKETLEREKAEDAEAGLYSKYTANP